MISQAELKLLVHYDPLTGVFTWLQGQRKGKEVGSVRDRRYVYARIKGTCKGIHRWAFLYMTGDIPDMVDHIDRNPQNNKWSNLREATPILNQVNVGVSKNNKQQIKGLCWDKHNNNWKGQVKINGKIRAKSHKDKDLVLAWLKEHHEIQAQSVGI